MRNPFWLCLALLSVGITAAAARESKDSARRKDAEETQTVSSISYKDLRGLAAEIGWTAEDKNTEGSSSLLLRAPNGIGFWAYPMQCKGQGEDAPCPLIQLQCVFDALPTNLVSYANQWNQSKAIGRAVLLTNNAYALDYLIVLEGGTTRANIARQLNLAAVASAEFGAGAPK